jgi:hypothetical protein
MVGQVECDVGGEPGWYGTGVGPVTLDAAGWSGSFEFGSGAEMTAACGEWAWTGALRWVVFDDVSGSDAVVLDTGTGSIDPLVDGVYCYATPGCSIRGSLLEAHDANVAWEGVSADAEAIEVAYALSYESPPEPTDEPTDEPTAEPTEEPASGEVTVVAFSGAALDELQRSAYVDALGWVVAIVLLAGILVAAGLRR